MYGVFVSANRQYLPYLNALLNSLVKREVYRRQAFDLLVITDGSIPQEYQDACAANLPYPVEFVQLPDDYHPEWSSAWRCKAGRYEMLRLRGCAFAACCLLDADLLAVSNQVFDFMRLVEETPYLIACNERIKWQIDSVYTLDGLPLLPEPTRLDKFHCNVPLYLDVKEWLGVLNDYQRIVFQGKELREQEKPVGDIYAWNIAVYREARQDDVVLMPMPGMTQVHRTGYRDRHCLLQPTPKGHWTTGDGDTVYCLHARPDRPGFRNIETKDEFEKFDISPRHFQQYARMVECEWLDVNFKYAIDLRKFVPEDLFWEAMGR